MATHSSILAQKIPWTEGHGGPHVYGVSKSRTQLKYTRYLPQYLQGRSPGEGKGYPLQYSCLENPIDK